MGSPGPPGGAVAQGDGRSLTLRVSEQVLELLLALCGVPGLRLPLCEVVFRPAAPQLRAGGRRQGPREAGPALLRWMGPPEDGAEACSLLALRLLTELLEVGGLG